MCEFFFFIQLDASSLRIIILTFYTLEWEFHLLLSSLQPDKRMWRSTFFTRSLSSSRFFYFINHQQLMLSLVIFIIYATFFLLQRFSLKKYRFYFCGFYCDLQFNVCSYMCLFATAHEYAGVFVLWNVHISSRSFRNLHWKNIKCIEWKKKSGIRFQGVVDFLLSSLRSLSTMQVIFNNNYPCTDVRNRRSIWFLAPLYTLFAIIGTYFFHIQQFFALSTNKGVFWMEFRWSFQLWF